MRAHLTTLLLAVASCVPAPGASTRPAPAPLERPPLAAQLASRIAQVPGAEVGLWLHDLGSGATVGLGDTLTFHAASTMKVPVMVELLRRVDAGALDLDDRLTLTNRFASIVDGSPYALTREDDSDVALYDRVGAPISFRELAHRMIVRSSNLATNVLIERLGAPTITATVGQLGATGVVVRRGVEDDKAFAAGLNNVVTARGLGRLMAAIARGEAASAASTAWMRQTLLAQEFNDEIPAGLPPGTPVAHKTGWITATTHDAAIIYPPGRRPIVLVVLTRAIPERDVAQRLIADLASLVWADRVGTAGGR